MLNWLENNTGRADGRVETLILQQKGWFGEFRGARDLLVHSGGETLVFGGPADGILFQIYKGWEGIIEHPYLMFNDNVLYFDRYAAFYLARLLVFWEELATVLVSMFPWNHKPNAQAGATGFLVLKKWMESLLCVVQESKTA